MKVRIKFAKEGHMKYLGHLDTMRYFQKALRRASLPVAYSEGFSPHMILSFALPLGVGMTSNGEYFDLQLAQIVPSHEMVDRLNRQMAEGFRVLSAVQVEDGKKGNAMSLVAACDYTIRVHDKNALGEDWQTGFTHFLEQTSIPMIKQTKRSEKTIDLRPSIYEASVEEEAILIKLASASSNYTKPELVMQSFASWLKMALPSSAYTICREEMYADLGSENAHRFVTLEHLGKWLH